MNTNSLITVEKIRERFNYLYGYLGEKGEVVDIILQAVIKSQVSKVSINASSVFRTSLLVFLAKNFAEILGLNQKQILLPYEVADQNCEIFSIDHQTP